MKNNKGEISIELIATVIVLIVLAAICIFMLTGDSGLFVPKGEEQNIQTNNTVDTNNNTNDEIVVPVE